MPCASCRSLCQRIPRLGSRTPGRGSGRGLLPIRLGAPGPWRSRSTPATCRFCGVRSPDRTEVFHLNGDHDDNRPDNLVPACALCHLAQHLDEAETSKAGTLIWLPEMSQAGVITVARGIHSLLLEHGERPSSHEPPRRRGPAVEGAWRAMSALRAREVQARDILGTSRPYALAAALLALDPTSYCERADLLDGIRLLPTGQLIRAGEDIYPELLSLWRQPQRIDQTRTTA